MDKDYQRFISDFEISSFTDYISKSKKSEERTFHTSKGQKKYADSSLIFEIKDEWIKKDISPKFLFAHFPPFKNELEALDFPLFVKTIFPNSIVDITYDKGTTDFLSFRISDNKIINQTSSLEGGYDYVIGRSGVFSNMLRRESHRDMLKKSGPKIQIKPMGLKKNRENCDILFNDDFLFCPPSPYFRNRCKDILKEIDKKNIAIFLGKVGREKNQLDYIRKIKNENIGEYSIVCLGNNTSEPVYANRIREECRNRGLNLYMINQVDHNVVPVFTCISKIHIINCDPRPFGQPYDPIPRCIGESAISNCHSLVSKTTLYNSEMSPFLTEYDHESESSINSRFILSKNINTEEYFKNLLTMEEKCMMIMNRVLSYGKA